ncbi:hypothetical protein BD408DRAFT_442373 [Parasitella parasitica]|nr:hypothetical protein BD408DRAFT_442373 [Parasitella parasitica]
MPLPKILAPLMPQSQHFQQKQHDSVLSPALPMSPPSNNPYNNMIGLATEETLVELNEDLVSETAVILHEKPTSFDMCDNDLLIESYHDNEQPDQKVPAPSSAFETTMTARTTYQSYDTSSSSLTMSLTESGNETLVEITTDDEIEEPVEHKASPMDRTTPVTPPQLAEDEHAFIDAMDHEQEFMKNPFNPATFHQSAEMAEVAEVAEEISHDIKKYNEEQMEQSDDLVNVETMQEEDFTQPIQALSTTHYGNPFDEPEEPDFKMKTNFKKTPSREGSLKSKCMKLIRGMKFRLSQEKKQGKKENRMKTTFSDASADQEGHIDTNLARSVSTVTIVDEERLTPIYRRNIAKSILHNLTKTEPFEPYKSPEIGSDAYDIKVLCDQSFFGRY